MISDPQAQQARSLEEVRQWFFDEGMAVTDWARQHGFRPESVYALLAGRTRGRRGQAHQAAVALGLKRTSQTMFAESATLRMTQSPDSSEKTIPMETAMARD